MSYDCALPGCVAVVKHKLCHNQKITDARELKEASARFVTLKASTSPKSKVTKVVV